MMKCGSMVLVLMVCAATLESAHGQCGCSSGYPAMGTYPTAYLPPPPPAALPRPSGPATIAYVNRLATPVPRSTYTLNYAVHLTDGRILLSDFLPKGYTVRGIESQSGEGGRRLSAKIAGTGSVVIRDPVNDRTIANFGSGYTR